MKPRVQIPYSERREYYQRVYREKRATGLCTRHGCSRSAIEGRALCEKHVAKQKRYRDKREQAMREKLPEDRAGTTQHFTILCRDELPSGEPFVREVKGYIQSGEYADGRLGELFVKMGKAGSSEALLDQWAIAVSIALQHGASVGDLFGKHVGTRFDPSGIVQGVRGIERCTSVTDMIARWVINRYGKGAR